MIVRFGALRSSRAQGPPGPHNDYRVPRFYRMYWVIGVISVSSRPSFVGVFCGQRGGAAAPSRKKYLAGIRFQRKYSAHPLKGWRATNGSEAVSRPANFATATIANSPKSPIAHITVTTAKDSGAKYGEFLAVAEAPNMVSDRFHCSIIDRSAWREAGKCDAHCARN